MAKKRPHTELQSTAFPTANPLGQPGDYSRRGLGGSDRSRAPQQPTGEVRMQKRNADHARRPFGSDPYEVGREPTAAKRERNPPGGKQKGLAMNVRTSAMPETGRQSATMQGPLARPGRELNSATMDARSSVPASIQEGPNTRDRFASLSYGDNDQRFDNAEIDDGTGTGRRARGTFRGERRM